MKGCRLTILDHVPVEPAAHDPRFEKLPDLTDKAVSVLSELLANAVVHARVPPGREIETRFIRTSTGVRIEVHDASDERPVLRAPDESGGFGLQLVDRLSTGGVSRSATGWASASGPR